MVSAIDPTKPADGVPARKEDLRASLWAAKREIEALQAGKIGHGDPIDMRYQQLSRAQLTGFSETVRTISVSAGTLTLNLRAGNVFKVILTENAVSLIMTNPPAPGLAGSCCLIVQQDGTGGRTLVWPRSIRWPGGVAPQISSAEDAVDIFAFVTWDGGVTWCGFSGGRDFR